MASKPKAVVTSKGDGDSHTYSCPDCGVALDLSQELNRLDHERARRRCLQMVEEHRRGAEKEKLLRELQLVEKAKREHLAQENEDRRQAQFKAGLR